MKLKILFYAAILLVDLHFHNLKLYIDSEYIISIMPEQQRVKELTSAYGAKLDTFNVKMIDYRAKVDAFKSLDVATIDSIKQKQYTELLVLEQDIQKYKENGTQLMQLKQNELMRPLYSKLSKTIQDVAIAAGFTQILTISGNEFAYIDEKFDITMLVMDRLGIQAPPAQTEE